MGDKGAGGSKGDCKGQDEVKTPRWPLRAGLFDPHKVAELQGDYKKSLPYQHLVIPDLMDEAVLRGACEELKTNMQATLKETDIFKVRYGF